MSQDSLINEEGEVRELTIDDMALFKSTADVLPAELVATLPKRGRPPKDQLKVSTTIRFDAEVLAYFRATGKGWQTRINDVLREYVVSQS